MGKLKETTVLMTFGYHPVILYQILVCRAVIGHDYLIWNAQYQTLEMEVLYQLGAIPVIYRYEY
jgi:hypothetical protein